MEALILRSEPAGEADSLVTVLTRDGRRMEGFAKSARLMPSKLRAGAMPLTVSDVTFIPGRHQWHLRSAQPVLFFPNFRESREALAAVSAIAAMLAEGTTEVSDPELYADAARAFRDLHTAASVREPRALLARRAAAAFLKTLAHLGYAPVFDRCTSCSMTETLTALSPSAGGILCGPCASENPESRTLSPEGTSTLKARAIPRSGGDVRELLRFLSAFSALHLPGADAAVHSAVMLFTSGA